MIENGRPGKEENNVAAAKTKNVAYNKNWNMVIFPNVDLEPGNDALRENGMPEMPDLVGKMMNDENENENTAVAAAAGKATVWNKNINVVLRF